jgi:WD40 repeat protein
VKQFAGHTAAVTCLQALKRKTTANAPIRLVSGSQDGSIKIWVCTTVPLFSASSAS